MIYICKLVCNFVAILRNVCIYILFVVFFLCGCKKKTDNEVVVTPWGTVIDSIPATDDFTLSDIMSNGELIMLTLSGPETYYDYHGKGMGTQFLLCEKFAQHLGVSLRVELCKDTIEMLSRLESGQADIIAYMLPKDVQGSDSLLFCGTNIRRAKNTHVKKSPSNPTTKEQKTPSSKETVVSSKKTVEKTDSVVVQWAVGKNNQELADALNRWYKPGMYDEMKKEEHFLLSSASVKRRVFSPFLNRSSGVISKYDDLFRKYAPVARWDWRLIAAQCYQESCFDPNARSWAGARGLMQIMPSTAAHLGLSMDQIHQPEPNIAAAVRYIRELSQAFSDIPSAGDRQCFVLASYNGGSFHVRDAMALTKKNGGNPKRWGDVSRYLRLLSDPQYYNDPVVKHGYMRSSETLDYVDKIRMRYAQYRGVPVGKMSSGQSVSPVAPRKAKKKYRFKV